MSRLTKLLAVLAIATAFTALNGGSATADSSTTLTIVGTSDVSDSGLFANVIAPQFEAAYPRYKIQYVGTASGTAITDAETGAAVSGGASVLLVHAASLENQFVASGYSYANRPGYAVFRNDFVLAGPRSDPAGVAAGARHNIAQAFVDIANAGYGRHPAVPRVTFVSRGGTPGTTVEEHTIWALIDRDGLRPKTLKLCAVSAADGGGETPVATKLVVKNGTPCTSLPAADQTSGLPSGAGLPAWYITTGANQGQNVLDADQCTSGTGGAHGIAASSAGSCYVMTDRGTYEWLHSGSDPAGAITHLAVDTRDNSASAPGGATVLLNYFHAYIINQAKVQAATGSTAPTVNLTAAQDLITLLTSPAFQASLRRYLATPTSGHPRSQQPNVGGAPFIGDASPGISVLGLSGRQARGSKVTVIGTVINPEPGYPAVAGQRVAIDQIVAGIPVPVAAGRTNATGGFAIGFSPKSTGMYQVATSTIAQVENAKLAPAFSDTLSPGASAPSKITVTARAPRSTLELTAVSLRRVPKRSRAKTTRATLTGKLAPGPSSAGSSVRLLALNLMTGALTTSGPVAIRAGTTSFSVRTTLARHTGYALQLEYGPKGHPSLESRPAGVTVN